MLVNPGSVAVVEFQSEIYGELIALTSPTALIYRGAIATSIVATIANPSAGIYLVSLTVPSDWIDYDLVSCRLSGVIAGKPISKIKPIGTVIRSLAAQIAALTVLSQRIEQGTFGRYQINSDSTMTFYGSDNTTVLATFQLRKAGAIALLTSIEIDERRVI